MSEPTPSSEPKETLDLAPVANEHGEPQRSTPDTAPADTDDALPAQDPPSLDEELILNVGTESLNEKEDTSRTPDSSVVESTNSDSSAIESPHRDADKNESQTRTESIFKGGAGRAKSLEHRARRRESDLQRILSHLATHTHITNDGIQKLVAVSDSTASRYAKILVLRGKLFRTGKGRSTRYTLPR